MTIRAGVHSPADETDGWIFSDDAHAWIEERWYHNRLQHDDCYREEASVFSFKDDGCYYCDEAEETGEVSWCFAQAVRKVGGARIDADGPLAVEALVRARTGVWMSRALADQILNEFSAGDHSIAAAKMYMQLTGESHAARRD